MDWKEYPIALWQLLFPKFCPVCGEILHRNEERFCFACNLKIPRTFFHKTLENEALKRFYGRVDIERATSFYFYWKEDKYAKLIHLFKYKGDKKLAEILGRMAAWEIQESGFFDGVDYLVPVPLHRKRLRSRGYNQSEWLCRGISSVTGIAVHTQLITRNHYTMSQVSQNVHERWENLNEAFQVNESAVASLPAHAHIMLLDDVLTTGATLTTCALTLKQAIPELKISIFTLAVAAKYL